LVRAWIRRGVSWSELGSEEELVGQSLDQKRS